MDFMLTATQKERFSSEFRHRLEHTEALPVLPEVARELLVLRHDANAGIPELVAVVERDPASAAQLLRHARLSMFGYGERINTVNDAVQLVLGFERSLHMVIGLAAGKPLRMEPGGPLGRKAFWKHSVYVAVLCQSLASQMPSGYRPNPGVAYLAGLMHDVGYLLLAHLYPHEFSLLNQAVERYSDIKVREIELISLGVSHDMVGMWLMRAWNMPKEVVVGVAEHCFPDYDGEYSVFPKLIYMANQALRYHNLGGNMSAIYEAMQIASLGIDEESFEQVIGRVFGISSELDQMSEEMAA